VLVAVVVALGVGDAGEGDGIASSGGRVTNTAATISPRATSPLAIAIRSRRIV
jgi:hypothetical protein